MKVTRKLASEERGALLKRISRKRFWAYKSGLVPDSRPDSASQAPWASISSSYLTNWGGQRCYPLEFLRNEPSYRLLSFPYNLNRETSRPFWLTQQHLYLEDWAQLYLEDWAQPVTAPSALGSCRASPAIRFVQVACVCGLLLHGWDPSDADGGGISGGSSRLVTLGC